MKTTEILDAVNRLLVDRWPERTVYVDVCPVDFTRPSFWLAVEKDERTDASRYLLRRDLRLRLTLYDRLDEHYDASWYRLAGEAEAVMELLGPPLETAGRHLKLQLKALPRDPDRAYVQIDAAWMEERPDYRAGSRPPLADSLHIRSDMI